MLNLITRKNQLIQGLFKRLSYNLKFYIELNFRAESRDVDDPLDLGQVRQSPFYPGISGPSSRVSKMLIFDFQSVILIIILNHPFLSLLYASSLQG